MATYYVDNVTGNNGDSGLTPADAWLTITYAVANIAGGDIVRIINTGVTYTDTFTETDNFSANPVTIRGNDSANPPIINPSAPWTFNGADGWTIQYIDFRGWTNYYRFAHNISVVAGRLATVVFWRVAHYLGKKHRQSLRKVMRRHYARDPRTGCKALFVQIPGIRKGTSPCYFIWHKRPQRLLLITNEAATVQLVKPRLNTSWATGHSLTRLAEARAEAQETCQGCGRSGVPLFLHHHNRLRNAKRVRKGYGNVAQSGLDQQGKLLCQSCHSEHHHGYTRQ